MDRVRMGGGCFSSNNICPRLFRLAVPHWFDHGSVSTSRSSVGSTTGAGRSLGSLLSRPFVCVPLSRPCHVSSPLHIAGNLRLSRIPPPRLLHTTPHGTSPTR